MDETTALIFSILLSPYILTIICLVYELIRYREKLRDLKFKEIVNQLWQGHRYYTGIFLQTGLWLTAVLFLTGIIFGLQRTLLWLFN